MELFAGFALLAALVVGFVLALKASFWIITFIVLPLVWLWMLVDAIARKAEDYPSKSTNEKILWIVLIVVFQVSAAVYFFMVWRAARNREATSSQPVSPVSPTASTAMVPAPPAQPPAV